MRCWSWLIVLVMAVVLVGCASLGITTSGTELKVSPLQPTSAAAKTKSVQVPPLGGRKVNIDGKLADGEWPEKPAIVLNKAHDTQEGQWSGPDDLSAKVYFMVDADNLYVAIDVTDDVYSQDETGGNIWKGDSVQLAFDPLHNPDAMRHRVDDYEYGFALASKGPVVWRWKSGPGKSNGLVTTVPLAIGKREGGLVYEAIIPFTELEPIAPLVKPDCGFTIAVNDSDGEGRASYLEWTPGIVASKDDSAFGELRFAYMPPSDKDVLMYLDIQRIFADDGQDFTFTVGCNARADSQVRMSVDVLEDDEKVTSASATIQVPKGVSWRTVSLPTDNLHPARYVLHVTAQDGKGNRIADQKFTVYRYSSKRDSSW